jgi:hypothetical protein
MKINFPLQLNLKKRFFKTQQYLFIEIDKYYKPTNKTNVLFNIVFMYNMPLSYHRLLDHAIKCRMIFFIKNKYYTIEKGSS